VNIGGVWTGEYRYDPEVAGPTVTFTLHLTQGWVGRISGEVFDGPGGMPEAGRIVGRLRGSRLTFLKLMPVAHILANGGTRILSEYAAEAGHDMAAHAPHPPIAYEGVVSKDGTAAAGTWRVDDFIVALADGVRALRFSGYNGSWVARRSNAAAER
jgi:hypothetical protein